jgi:DnaJ-class molecular chaperone
MKTKTCPECDGEGVLDKETADERQCPNCGGTGIVADDATGLSRPDRYVGEFEEPTVLFGNL